MLYPMISYGSVIFCFYRQLIQVILFQNLWYMYIALKHLYFSLNNYTPALQYADQTILFI